MPARTTDKTSKPAVPKPAKRTAAKGKVATKLPETMITEVRDAFDLASMVNATLESI